MTWFKVDDNLTFHRKVLVAGNAAMGLWVRAGAWCAQHGTNGRIPAFIALKFGTRAQVKRLVLAGLWETAEDEYQFHEWPSHQRPDYRARIPDAVRYSVYERDGYRCRECGADSPLSLDHIWPWSLGGTDEPDNLQTLCIPCNCRKGARVE